jgi:hypothetical protein
MTITDEDFFCEAIFRGVWRIRFPADSRLILDFAVAHADMAGGHGGKFGTVSDDYEGDDLLRGDPDEGLGNACRIGAIEIPGRFVGEEELRRTGQGAGDGGSLHLPAAELVREVAAAIAEPDEVQHGRNPGAGFRGRISAKQERELDILGKGHARKQVEKLEDDPQIVAAVVGELALPGTVQGQFADPDFPRVGAIQAAKEIEQGALSTAAGTGYRYELAIRQVEADLVQGADGVSGF